MARAKSEFKQQKNIPIKNKKQSKKVKPQKEKKNKFVKLAIESMQSQDKAAAGNQGKKSLGVKRKQHDVDNGVKKFKNNKDQAILRVHNSNNNIQKEVKDSPWKLIKSSGSLKQDNLKIQSLDAKKKSVVKMGKVKTSEQNTDIKKMDIKSSHSSESIEKIPSAQQATGCRKRKNEILKHHKLEYIKQEPTRPNPSKQKTVAGSRKDNFTQLDNVEKVLLVQKVRSRRRKKRAVSQKVTPLSTVKHGFPNNKNSSEKVENMKLTQPQPKLKEKSVQKAKNVEEIVVDPISDTYLFGSLKVKQGGIYKKDKLDDCLENLKKQKYLNIVQEPIQQTTNFLKKKSYTSLGANQKQNEQFNCEKIPKDMEISKTSKSQNLAQEPIKPEAIEKFQSEFFLKISPVKQVQIGKQDKKTNFEKKSKEKQVNISEKVKSISQKQIQEMINNAKQNKTEEDKQNILKEIQDNLEKKSRGSKPENIAQNSVKEKDTDRSQSSLKKKEKHDKCEKISKGLKPENKASKPIKRKKSEASLTGLIQEIVPVKQVIFEKQNQDSCEKKSEDKQDNFIEKFKNISQNQIQQMINNAEHNKTEEDKQNILKEIQDNIEKKSKGSKPESIAQNSIKDEDSGKSQSGLKKKKKHDKCEKISKGLKPENKASKPIKRKKSEASLTGLIQEIVPVKQVIFEKQNQDSCEKKSEDKQDNFIEKFKNISQNQIQQMINNAEHNKTEEDKQNILKEIQDNIEKKSKGSKPESIAQNSIKDEDSGKSQSGLKKKKKHDKCEKISKGLKPENKASKPIKRKKSEASLTGLIQEIVPVKQVLFEKQNQDSCEKKSEDKQDNFIEKFKKIFSQNQIQQMINNAEQNKTEEDKQNILKENQDNIEKKSKGSKPESIAQNSIKDEDSGKSQSGLKKKKKHDKCEKISKGLKPENKALKPIKSQIEASLTGLIEEIVPVTQVQFQKQDQDSCEKKSKDNQVNFSEKFKCISQKQIQQMIDNAEQNKIEEDKQNILKEIQDNLEKKSRGSKPESIAQNSIKEIDSERSQSKLKKKKKRDKCEKISKGSNPENNDLKPIKSQIAEASLTGLIEEIVPVTQVQFQKQDQDSCEKKSKDKQVNFIEKFKNISQNQIQQMINNAEQNKTEEDKQNILKEIQDNLEKKSRGSKPESIAQNSVKEKDTDRSQSSLKKKEKHDKCEKISKGLKPENKASKPIKRKKSEASLTGLIQEIVPVKQVLFEKQNQDSCEKKSEDKQDNFVEKFKNISQNQIQQMINNAEQNKTEEDKQNILKENQDNIEKKSKGSKPESIAQNSIKDEDSGKSQSGLKKKKKHDKCEKISKGLKPENKALKPIKSQIEASLTGLIEEIVPVTQVQFQKQDQDSCEKKSKDNQVNFSEKFKCISQKQIQQMIDNAEQNKIEEDKQNILKEIQDNLEKKSRGSKPESIAQNSVKEKHTDRSQSSLKNKEKHDKCEKISKGLKPENKASKPIKRKKSEASLTGLIQEIVPVKQVLFEKQNQDSCEKKSEDKQDNFVEKFKNISQNQIQQMINNAEQNKTEEDKQNILKEIQDNIEKKSKGSKPESIAQNSIKDEDSGKSQSGLKKKKKHDKCEKISKGLKPENKALKPIKSKKAEASQTGLIEVVVPVKQVIFEKQVLFEKQNQDCCEKKSEDKQDNFKENLEKAKFENIEQEPIQQSINDQKKNYLTLQDIIQNHNKENNHKMLNENQDSVKQVKIQKRENKSKEKFENIIQELINKTTNGKQEEVQPSQSGLIGRMVLIKPVAIWKEINCETNLKSSKPENTTLHQNCVSNIKPEESFKAQFSKSPLNQVYDDQSKQINCSEKSIEKSEQKLIQHVNNTQEMRVETSKSGLIGPILSVMQDNKRDSCTKNSKRKREPIEMQAVQLENKVQKVKSVESELKRHKISNLVKPTQLVAPGKVTICHSDTRITNLNCENNISPLQQENSEQYQLHLSMDEMLNERWRKMKVNVEKSENKIRSQFMRCTEYVLTNEGTEELTEEPMQTKKADEIKQTSLIGKLKSLLKRRLTCHF